MNQPEPTMDPSQAAAAASTTWGSLGIIAGAIFMSFMFVNQFWQNRGGENMRVKALTEDVARLENRLRDETTRADENEERADKMAGQRNDLIREFADIKSELAKALERLEWLTKQNEQLIGQNQELTKRLNDFIQRGNT